MKNALLEKVFYSVPRSILCARHIGPVTAALLVRTLFSLALVNFLCAGLVIVNSSVGVDVFALGLSFPGAGFLASGTLQGFMFFVGFMALFLFALFIWFATGAIVLPPLVWLLVSMLAALPYQFDVSDVFLLRDIPGGKFKPENIVLVLPIVLGLVWAGIALILSRKDSETPSQAIQALPQNTSETETDFIPRELSPREMAQMRFLLDRALQPLAEFEGFEKLDQFQSGALRYQLQFPGFALAMVQARCLPAFSGYLEEAQINLIEKQRNPKIWSYWKWESLWGRLSLDANPLGYDNIMFTGFTATQMALFENASGNTHFSKPNSFSLTATHGKNYPSDLGSMISGLCTQFEKSKFTLIACEPNWVFPVCNAIGLVALKAKANHWRTLEPKLSKAFQTEFKDRHDNFITCRSSSTGLAIPAIGGALTQLLPSFFLNASLPDLALANWQKQRRRIITDQIQGPQVKLSAFWPIDVGNYRFTKIAGLAGAAATASEMGDQEARMLFLNALDKLYPSKIVQGIFHRKNASLWAHSFELMAQIGNKDTLKTLAASKPKPKGIHISHVDYPQIMVASAFSKNDVLSAVLCAQAPKVKSSVTLSGLVPATVYQFIQQDVKFTADKNGNGTMEIEISTRTEMTVKLNRKQV